MLEILNQAEWLNQHAWERNLPVDDVWPRVEREKFQGQLNEITGLEADASPRLRLVWGAQFPETLVKNRVTGEMEPRYPFRPHVVKRTNPATGLEEMHTGIVCLPRFFVEIQCPVQEVLFEEGERGEAPLAEKGVYTDGLQYQAADLESIRWMQYLEICQHDHFKHAETGNSLCCDNFLAKGVRCHGQFRLPDSYDLNYIARRWQAAKAARKSRIGDVLSPEDQTRIHRQLVAEHIQDLYRQLQEQQERRREYEDFLGIKLNGARPFLHLGA